MESERWCNLLRPPPIPFLLSSNEYKQLFNHAINSSIYRNYAKSCPHFMYLEGPDPNHSTSVAQGSSGTAVVIVLVLLVLIAAVIGLYFLWRRHRKTHGSTLPISKYEDINYLDNKAQLGQCWKPACPLTDNPPPKAHGNNYTTLPYEDGVRVNESSFGSKDHGTNGLSYGSSPYQVLDEVDSVGKKTDGNSQVIGNGGVVENGKVDANGRINNVLKVEEYSETDDLDTSITSHNNAAFEHPVNDVVEGADTGVGTAVGSGLGQGSKDNSSKGLFLVGQSSKGQSSVRDSTNSTSAFGESLELEVLSDIPSMSNPGSGRNSSVSLRKSSGSGRFQTGDSNSEISLLDELGIPGISGSARNSGTSNGTRDALIDNQTSATSKRNSLGMVNESYEGANKGLAPVEEPLKNLDHLISQ